MMTNGNADELELDEAIEALLKLEDYEEFLTAKILGLNLMIFAFAFAAIPISYVAAVPSLSNHEHGSIIFGLLWIPWIAAATAVTSTLWTMHSISLGKSSSSISDWILGIGFAGLFLLIFVGIASIFGDAAGVFVLFGITGGVLTCLVGIVLRYLYQARWVLIPLLIAGTGIVLGNLLLHGIGLSDSGTGIVSGFVQGTVYFVTGWIISIRG